MKFITIIAAIFLSLSAISQKVAYVNVTAVFQSMPAQKAAQAQLDQYSEALQVNIKDKTAALNEEVAKYNSSDTSKLTEVYREIKHKDFNKRLVALQNLQQSIQQDLQAKQAELVTPLQKALLDAVNSVMKEKGYSIVLNGDQVVSGSPDDNITELVKKKLLPVIKDKPTTKTK